MAEIGGERLVIWECSECGHAHDCEWRHEPGSVVCNGQVKRVEVVPVRDLHAVEDYLDAERERVADLRLLLDRVEKARFRDNARLCQERDAAIRERDEAREKRDGMEKLACQYGRVAEVCEAERDRALDALHDLREFIGRGSGTRSSGWYAVMARIDALLAEHGRDT
jgi:hypothetical protein